MFLSATLQEPEVLHWQFGSNEFLLEEILVRVVVDPTKYKFFIYRVALKEHRMLGADFQKGSGSPLVVVEAASV